MRSKGLIALFAGLFLVTAATFGVIGWAAWKIRRPAAADPADLARERDADRAEAAAAFRDPAPPTPEQQAEFAPLLNRLGTAIKQGDAGIITGSFNIDRMADEFGRVGGFDTPIGRRIGSDRVFRDSLRNAIGPSLAARRDEFAWEESRIRRVRMSADGLEAVIIAAHPAPDADGFTHKVRWWLTRRSGSWQVYDLEDLSLGIRITAGMSVAIGALGGGPDSVQAMARMKAAAVQVQRAMVALTQSDAAAAEKALAPARGANLPGVFAALRAVAEGFLAILKDRPEDALGFFDQADRLQTGMPIVLLGRTAAFNHLGRYADTLDAAAKYAEQLGPDSTVMLNQGFAFEQLGRADEAAFAYRQSLDEYPNEAESLSGLARTLPAGKKGELGDRLAKLKDPEETFTTLANEALERKDYAAATALTAAFRKLRPAHVDGLFYAARVALDQKKLDEALPVIADACAAPAANRPAVVRRVVWAFADAGHAIAAYRAAPPAGAGEVFQAAASAVLSRSDPEDEEDEATEKWREDLKALVSARFAAAPADPWVAFYRGELHVLTGDFAEADQAFAAAAGKVAAADRGTVRGRQVFVRYKLEKGRDAYREFGPDRAVFAQLAALFESDGDAEGLLALVADHTAKDAADPVLPFWIGSARWLKKELPAAVAAYRTYLAAVADDEEVYRAWQARDRIIRGLVRSKEPADARAALTGFGDKAQPVHRVLVAAAAGDAEGTLSLIEELVENETLTVDWLYADEDLGPLLRAPGMKPVRDKYPEPKPAAPPKRVG
jgi:tetratricopeptide (TPR) repeat protein